MKNVEPVVLIIKVINNIIVLELIKVLEKKRGENGQTTIANYSWEDNGNTSKELLRQIDKFLQKNNLIVQDLSKVKTEIDKKQKYTLARIVQIVAKTMNYCLVNNVLKQKK